MPELSLLSGATLVMELTNGDSAVKASTEMALDMFALLITLHRYAGAAPGISMEPGILKPLNFFFFLACVELYALLCKL